MPILTDSDRATLSGRCRAEEAETLLDWGLRHPDGSLDLGECLHLHSAVLQTLLALGRPVAVPPADPWIATLLAVSLR